jgi:hypothetical protein
MSAISIDKALGLLRGGAKGVAEWNAWRKSGEEIAKLNGAYLGQAAQRAIRNPRTVTLARDLK